MSQQCSHEQALGHGWRTGQDQTRLLVTFMWDGRCGHCLSALVDVNELGIHSAPLDVDHLLPTANRGCNALMNYMASCDTCNRSRQTSMIERESTIEGVFRMRNGLVSDFRGYLSESLNTDASFTELFWTGVRCSVHDWHIFRSPAYQECRDQCLAPPLWEQAPAPVEWWSRFGPRSSEILNRANQAAVFQGLSALERRSVLGHLPRYALDADHARELLSSVSHPADYRKLAPAASHWLSVTLPFAPSVSLAATKRRDRAAMLQLDSNLKEIGISWWGIADLWVKRQWPTEKLFYHRVAVKKLVRAGKRDSLAHLEKLQTATDVEKYFTILS